MPTITIDPTVLDSIQAIVDYNWSDEAADFERSESEGNCREDHIFSALEIVDEWLRSVPINRPSRLGDVWTDWPEAATVERFYADYLARRRALEAAGQYTYNDDFRGHFDPPVESVPESERLDKRGRVMGEDTVIYFCQVRHGMEKIRAKVEARLAEGYEPIDRLDATTKFRGVVLYPTNNMGGEYAYYSEARLVPETYAPQIDVDGHAIRAVIPKGKRTRGHLVMGRRVLVLR